MIKETIAKVVQGESLILSEAQSVMDEIMRGEATPSQIAGLLVALRMKGETPEEIAGCAKSMRAHSLKVSTTRTPVLDTCGTGGDNVGSFNISTITAFVLAGAGVAVAKHGNRSVSSRCGSADVLEHLGVKIDLTPDKIGKCIDEIGIGFLFAPCLHPAMKYAAVPRREMGIRTMFNVLGPLTNPASASLQLLGVYDSALTETLAEVLQVLGAKRAFVIHGANGMDELSTMGTNKVTRLDGGKLDTFYMEPEELGITKPASIDELKGADVADNAEIMAAVFKGDKGPHRDIVLLNAAFGLTIADKVSSYADGLTMAAEVIDSGKAQKMLNQLISMTQSL